MHTRSGVDASPSKSGLPSNPDGEAIIMNRGPDGLRRSWKRASGRNGVSFADQGKASSRKSPKKSPMKNSGPPKDQDGQASSSRSRKKSTMKKGSPKQEDGNDGHTTKANHPDGPFQHRFSLHRFHDVKFKKEQIQWINEAGFGALLCLPNVALPTQLVAFVLDHISTDLREFRQSNNKKKHFPLDKQLVCNILGVPSGEVPVKVTSSADEYQDYLKIRQPFMGSVRGLAVSDCKELVKNSTDQATFMRAFILLVLGSVLCPTSDNCISVKYLHSLHDVSPAAIKSFDWAGHVLDVLMSEVVKYQKAKHEAQAAGVSICPYINGCLIIPAIAYMDHLRIPPLQATHQIDYSVPRICYVSNKDFEFVKKVDKYRLMLNPYPFGWLPFVKSTPYLFPVPLTGYVPPTPPMPEEVVEEEEEAVNPSFQDWAHGAGPSSPPASDATAPGIEAFPEELHILLEEHNSLVEQDLGDLVQVMKKKSDDLFESIKKQVQLIMAKRGAELCSKVLHLTRRTSRAPDVPNTKNGKDPFDGNDPGDGSSDFMSFQPEINLSSPPKRTDNPSTSAARDSRDESAKDYMLPETASAPLQTNVPEDDSPGLKAFAEDAPCPSDHATIEEDKGNDPIGFPPLEPLKDDESAAAATAQSIPPDENTNGVSFSAQPSATFGSMTQPISPHFDETPKFLVDSSSPKTILDSMTVPISPHFDETPKFLVDSSPPKPILDSMTVPIFPHLSPHRFQETAEDNPKCPTPRPAEPKSAEDMGKGSVPPLHLALHTSMISHLATSSNLMMSCSLMYVLIYPGALRLVLQVSLMLKLPTIENLAQAPLKSKIERRGEESIMVLFRSQKDIMLMRVLAKKFGRSICPEELLYMVSLCLGFHLRLVSLILMAVTLHTMNSMTHSSQRDG